ncbi:N-acyl-D-amino-acid deacylase [Arthrobacter psychrolactophilus]|uniref:N-acyl-D-amino-acid deacylase n=1 Tax=Arthrobacter psychrolactophilus TaxID=92442 RepID=A0A2V5JME7_9MICC|nr:D-aminoacylase [Arthrobacter psychrolactophilus]PYI39246.1 N-acyl-D-amino-acid deacylase [Arthrobacter psychrolactophilus]
MGESYLIKGGSIVDGTGRPARRADIGIVNGTMVEPAAVSKDAVLVDATGLVVSPGFIDVHTHSDATTIRSQYAGKSNTGPLALAAVMQGATLEIAGNCGYSVFPGADTEKQVDALAEFTATLFGNGIPVCDDIEEYAQRQNDSGRFNNISSLVGHSSLRAAVMGFEQREATVLEIATMERLLSSALDGGAVGWSSGLIYPPGTYAGTDELIHLGKISARHGVPYVTHLRDEMQYVEEALEEALHIARQSGTSLHVSHHKTAGKFSHGRSVQTLATMDAARREGLDVTCDVYPYVAASTHLHAMLPPWSFEGGMGALLRRLHDPAARNRMRADIAGGIPSWENTVGNGGWDRIDVATAPGRTETQGISVAALAARAGQDAVDFVADLLISTGGHVTIISHSMEEADMQRVLAHPGTMVGSDGVPKDGKPHPRWAGTFARILGRYVRDLQVLELEEAVHRMTALPAQRFGLNERGILAPGNIADVTIFDPHTVSDQATFVDSLLPPTGIEHVFIAGRRALQHGVLTGTSAGTFVARSR